MSTAVQIEDIDPFAPLPETEAEFARLLESQAWRLNNLYFIKNKQGDRVLFRLNQHQWKFYHGMHTRNLILKARQLGFTTFMQIFMLDECMFKRDTNAGVVAHNQTDAQSFFKDKILYAYNELLPYVRQMHPAKNESAGELRFANGSVIRVGTSLRSGTLQLLHVSEYGKLCAKFPDRATEVRTGTLPTVPQSGITVIESTAEGRQGDFFSKAESARRLKEQKTALTALDYKFHFFPWHENPEYRLDGELVMRDDDIRYFEELAAMGITLDDAQKLWYLKTREELNAEEADMMKREHPSYPQEAFEASIEGAYFSRQMSHVRGQGQITRIPIERNIPIQTFWDLGRDTTAIWFFQQVGFDYRFIDYFQNSGEDILYYADILRNKRDGEYPYLYGDIYLPHDGDRQSLASKQSVAKVLHDMGYDVRIVRRTPSKDYSIANARKVLPRCWFEENRCAEGISMLDGYRKEWDDKLGTWKNQPLHDICSHGADAFMTFADGFAEVQHNPEADAIEASQMSGRNQTTGY